MLAGPGGRNSPYCEHFSFKEPRRSDFEIYGTSTSHAPTRGLRRLTEQKLYPLLIQAIDCFVLQRESGPITLDERALLIAQTLASTASTQWDGREVVDSIAIANREAKLAFYPGDGPPALRFLFKP